VSNWQCSDFVFHVLKITIFRKTARKKIIYFIFSVEKKEGGVFLKVWFIWFFEKMGGGGHFNKLPKEKIFQ
jgi:hypothetical protein